MTKSHTIEINGQCIGGRNRPYLIAEMSANHNGSLASALNIIDAAKESGADAIKIQTYTADTITIDSDKEDFKIKDGLWKGKTLYELYDLAHTPWNWHEQLFLHAKDIGITIFSSPFDNTSVDFLEELGTPAYKIASFEAVDIPLIKYAASKGKPLIISTGMANQPEINNAIRAARSVGNNQIAILHCVSGYPAPSSDYNLKTLTDMLDRFEVVIGLSDHTLDNITSIVSISLGASIVEKHFTLDRSNKGPDDSFSLEPDEFKQLRENIDQAWEALGHVNYDRKLSEKNNIKFRRSLYFVKDVKKGNVITSMDIKSIRPGYGLAPEYKEHVVGSKATKNIERGEPVLTSLFEVEV